MPFQPWRAHRPSWPRLTAATENPVLRVRQARQPWSSCEVIPTIDLEESRWSGKPDPRRCDPATQNCPGPHMNPVTSIAELADRRNRAIPITAAAAAAGGTADIPPLGRRRAHRLIRRLTCLGYQGAGSHASAWPDQVDSTTAYPDGGPEPGCVCRRISCSAWSSAVRATF